MRTLPKWARLIFQFTPLREGRQTGAAAGGSTTQFQFTPLREGRRLDCGRQRLIMISIHAPPRGATRFEIVAVRPGEFQFTPLREGRHRAALRLCGGGAISIHAPPRGATAALCCACADVSISIHAPPRGATGKQIVTDFNAGVFQFTPLREGRRQLNQLAVLDTLISIHAPPRGATLRFFQLSGNQLISIHAPPRGATPREHPGAHA